MSVRTLVKSIQDIMRQDTGVDGDAQRISQMCWMFFLKIIDDQDSELEIINDGYRSPVPPKCQWRKWAADPEGITGDGLLAFVNNELFPTLKGLPTSTKVGDRRRVVKDVFEDAFNYMKSGQLMRQVVNKINGIDFNDLSERQHFGDIYEQILADLQSAGNAGEYYTPRAVTAFMVDRIDPHPGEFLLDPACGTGGFLTGAIRHMRDRYVTTPAHEKKMQGALRAVEKKQLPHMLCVTNMLLHNIEDPSFVRHDNTLARPYISYTQSDRVDIVLTNPPFGGKEEDGIESNLVPDAQKAYSMTKPIRLEHLQDCINWWGGLQRKGRAETSQAWRVTADEVKARGYNLDIKNPHTVREKHGDPAELLQKLDAAEADVADLRDKLKSMLADALSS